MVEYQKPDYSMTFDGDEGEIVKAAEADLNALTKKVLQALNPSPVIDNLPDTFINLPVGIVVDGELIKDAEVQELNGEHEEKLAKARLSNSLGKYVTTLLQCGVVSIGGKEPTTVLLDSLIIGDIDALILGIRRATFGDDFEVFNVECSSCKEASDIQLDLKNVPFQKFTDVEELTATVPLRRGRKAKIQYPNGHVQNELLKKVLTDPEMYSITLAHCVISIIEVDGSEIPSNGLASVKKLGKMDRDKITEFIFKNQPGPRYDKVLAACPSCEGEVLVPINMGILFREF
jgi:hypothetical protein